MVDKAGSFDLILIDYQMPEMPGCRLKMNRAAFSVALAAGRTLDDGCKEIDQIQLTP